MSRLETGETAYGPGAFAAQRYVEAEAARSGVHVVPRTPPAAVSDVVTAVAYVSAGRWVVDCPFPGCASAQQAQWGDRRFFCPSCQNAAAGGAFVRVRWPIAETVAQIETILLDRPNVANRHWFPWEKVTELAVENEAHRAELARR